MTTTVGGSFVLNSGHKIVLLRSYQNLKSSLPHENLKLEIDINLKYLTLFNMVPFNSKYLKQFI
jgi:hypothetical protein